MKREDRALLGGLGTNWKSVFYGKLTCMTIPKNFSVSPLTTKEHRVQNAAARLLTGSKRTEHITPTLRNLHWLPVQQRIKFKTALLVYKALNGMSPTYIKELVVPYTPARRLRSCDKGLLKRGLSNTVN